MSLPEYITNMFNKLTTGVLNPFLSGLFGIIPTLSVIMVVISLIWLIFASRKGPALVTLIITLLICFFVNDIPSLINAIFNYSGASGTVDVSSAADTASQALQNGQSNIQGLS